MPPSDPGREQTPAGVVRRRRNPAPAAPRDEIVWSAEDAAALFADGDSLPAGRQYRRRGTYLRKGRTISSGSGVRWGRGRAVARQKQTVLFADGHFEALRSAADRHRLAPVRPPIPGVDLPEVQTCWTLADAPRHRRRWPGPARGVQPTGAGFIGCIIEALAKQGVRPSSRWATGWCRADDDAQGRRHDERWVDSRACGSSPRPVSSASTAGGGDAPLRVSPVPAKPCPCDLVIVATGVAPASAFLDGTPVCRQGGAGGCADGNLGAAAFSPAGDVAEGAGSLHRCAPVGQPNAADQAGFAAINMAGGNARMPGVLAINGARYPPASSPRPSAGGGGANQTSRAIKDGRFARP